MNSDDKMSFNDSFVKTLKQSVFLENKGDITYTKAFQDRIDTLKISDSGTRKHIRLMGRDGTWLSKELNKWKKKLFSQAQPNFQGTLQNLEIYCRITGEDPNSILLNQKDFYLNKTTRVTYLTYDTLEQICSYIIKNNSSFSEDLLFPVIATPQKMLTMFIKIYRPSKYSRDVHATFWFSEYGKDECGISSYPIDTENYIVNLTTPQKSMCTLKEAYDEAIAWFKGADQFNDFPDHMAKDLAMFIKTITPSSDDALFLLYAQSSQTETEQSTISDGKYDIDSQIMNADRIRQKDNTGQIR